MPRVGAAAVSPDGRFAVFPVVEPSYEKDKQASDLWLVATDGKSAPRRLTQTRTPESGPIWSADSKRIAFTAKRDGDEADQIYVLDLAGGEAQRVTQISTGARLPKFSPDGTRIAFTSNVHPDARDDAQMRKIVEEEKARKYNVRAYTSFPIRNWDQWLSETREPHAFVQTLGEPQARDLFAGTAFIKQAGFAGRTTQEGSELDLAWTPDGQSLVFAATRNAQSHGLRLHQYRALADRGDRRRATPADRRRIARGRRELERAEVQPGRPQPVRTPGRTQRSRLQSDAPRCARLACSQRAPVDLAACRP